MIGEAKKSSWSASSHIWPMSRKRTKSVARISETPSVKTYSSSSERDEQEPLEARDDPVPGDEAGDDEGSRRMSSQT